MSIHLIQEKGDMKLEDYPPQRFHGNPLPPLKFFFHDSYVSTNETSHLVCATLDALDATLEADTTATTPASRINPLKDGEQGSEVLLGRGEKFDAFIHVYSNYLTRSRVAMRIYETEGVGVRSC